MKDRNIIDRAFFAYVDSLYNNLDERICIEELVRIDNETFEFLAVNYLNNDDDEIRITLKLLNAEIDEAGVITFDSSFLGGFQHLNEKVEMSIDDLPVITKREALYIQMLCYCNDDIDELLGRESGFWGKVVDGECDIKPYELKTLWYSIPNLYKEFDECTLQLLNSIKEEYSNSIKSSNGPVRSLLPSIDTMALAYNEEGLKPTLIDESTNLLLTSFEIEDINFSTNSVLICMKETIGTYANFNRYWRPLI